MKVFVKIIVDATVIGGTNMLALKIRSFLLLFAFISLILTLSTAFSAPIMSHRGMMMDEDQWGEMMQYRYGMGPMMTGYPMWGPMFGDSMMGGPMMGMGMGPFMGGLDLSADQRKKIRSIWRELRGQQWDDMEKIMSARDELFDAVNEEKPDPKKVGEAYLKMVEAQKRAGSQHVKARDEFLNVLTYEQKKRLQSRPYFGGFGPRHGMMR
jgi:Spy/CpxP family protein refolding chaperone